MSGFGARKPHTGLSEEGWDYPSEKPNNCVERIGEVGLSNAAEFWASGSPLGSANLNFLPLV
jgi:hypothetical protein